MTPREQIEGVLDPPFGEVLCELCDAKLYVTMANGELTKEIEHECHCLLEDRQGSAVVRYRIATGICCGRRLGEAMLREEDFHDGAAWAVPSDCTCPRRTA